VVRALEGRGIEMMRGGHVVDAAALAAVEARVVSLAGDGMALGTVQVRMPEVGGAVLDAAVARLVAAEVVRMEGLDGVLPGAEFLVLAPPHTLETEGILSRARIAILPRGAGLVNIGRGALVDQDAVMDALDSGHLGGAVLDVFTPEPVPPGHRLWGTPNLVMTPHVSADDPATYNARSLDIFFENLLAMREGRAMTNQFDPVRGY